MFPPTQMIRLLWLRETEPRVDLPMGQLLWSILLAWKTLHLHLKDTGQKLPPWHQAKRHVVTEITFGVPEGAPLNFATCPERQQSPGQSSAYLAVLLSHQVASSLCSPQGLVTSTQWPLVDNGSIRNLDHSAPRPLTFPRSTEVSLDNFVGGSQYRPVFQSWLCQVRAGWPVSK